MALRPHETVATRGFLALPEPAQALTLATWEKVLRCPHIWQAPDENEEQRCALCQQKRVPSIEETPGLIVVKFKNGGKAWVKKDEYPVCSCPECRTKATRAREMMTVHSDGCKCFCEKRPIDVWTFLLPEEY